ncbi:MAG: pyridoxamine 5'-phosphate oxidase family protein [Aeromicrobium sp.]
MTAASEGDRMILLKNLTPDECYELLRKTTVGQIAFVDDEGQQLMPVNFIVLDELIYFRTVYTGILAQLTHGHRDVAFGANGHDDTSHTGWNVTVRGSARQVEDRATINKVLSGLSPWAGGVRSTVIEVRPQSVAGRKI